jgi:hypothetical protein
MKRRTSGLLVWAVIVSVLSVVLVPAGARAAEDVLKVIPDSCLGFLVINRLAATNEKLVEVQRQLQFQVANPLTILKDNTGIKEGLDEKRSAAMVAFAGKEEDEDAGLAFVLFAPVTDYAKVLAALKPKDAEAKIAIVEVMGSKLLVRKVSDFAVFAEPKHRSILEKVGTGKDVSQSVARWNQWLEENDIALVVTRNGVRQIALQVGKNLGEMEQILGQTPETGESAMPSVVSILKIYRQIITAAEKEVSQIGVGIQRNKAGDLLLSGRKAFVEGGTVAKALAGVHGAQGNMLSSLPDTPFVVAFSGDIPAGLGDNLGKFSTSIMALDPGMKLSKEQAQKIMDNAVELSKGMSRLGMLLTVGKPDADLYSRILVTYRVDDANAYLDKYEKHMQSYNEIIKDGDTGIPPAALKKMKVEGKPALQISMDYGKLLSNEEAPLPKELLEKMFGRKGKIVAYLVAADKQTLLAGYTTQDQVRSGLKVLQKGSPSLDKDQGVAATAALLPPGAPWVGYLAPSGTIEFASHMTTMFQELSSGLKLAEFPKTKPIGFAGQVADNEVQTFLVMPVDVVQAIGVYMKKMETAEK